MNNITEIEEFVKKNYSTMGLKYIVDKFGTNTSRVARMAKKYGLSVSKEARSKICTNAFDKSPEKYNVNHLAFIDIKSPEIAYILGLLWADGHISKHGTGHYIVCSTTAADEVDLEKVFSATGKWNKYIKPHDPILHPKWKPAITFQTTNKHLFLFLETMDYTNKTGCSPSKIINHIPEDLRHYWWRGFFDGDGCIYTKGTRVQINFAGPYEQDWSFAESLMKFLDITKFAAKQNISNKNHKSSAFRFCSKEGAKRFMEYIYREYEKFPIGLTRKYNKFKSFDFTYKR